MATGNAACRLVDGRGDQSSPVVGRRPHIGYSGSCLSPSACLKSERSGVDGTASSTPPWLSRSRILDRPPKQVPGGRPSTHVSDPTELRSRGRVTRVAAGMNRIWHGLLDRSPLAIRSPEAWPRRVQGGRFRLGRSLHPWNGIANMSPTVNSASGTRARATWMRFSEASNPATSPTARGHPRGVARTAGHIKQSNSWTHAQFVEQYVVRRPGVGLHETRPSPQRGYPTPHPPAASPSPTSCPLLRYGQTRVRLPEHLAFALDAAKIRDTILAGRSRVSSQRGVNLS